jgi:hypothetical protein
VFAWFGPTTETAHGRNRSRRLPGGGLLVCPECGASVRETLPGCGPRCVGLRPSYAHRDGAPLRPVPVGYRPAEPIPAGRAYAARVTVPDSPRGPVALPPPSAR